jgi:pimeloyl-ACP methyl ester carboxylesterase
VDLMPGVRADTAETDRLRVHYLEAGPPDGVPVVLVHGNLSTGRFYEALMSAAADGPYRFLAPDMRGFGRTERAPIDATRGLRDWSDDVHALLRALGVDAPPHLAGWSTGGGAVASYGIDRPVASVTLIDPVSPYGFGGCHLDGTPCAPDWAGTGGGTGNPDVTARIAAGDRSGESPFSPRTVMNSAYWTPTHREPPEREDVLVDEVLLSVTGDDGYPGDATPSDSWPGFAPGTRGILNALSGRYCDWSGLVDVDPKPPVLWTHGSADVVIADGSAWEIGTLGSMGAVPGWPGEQEFPPQQMVTQIREVLRRYEQDGGRVVTEVFEGSGHFPVADAAERWRATFLEFLASAR